MTFWKWSRVAASNGAADSTCPFPEGMAPSALNDGARGMMAAASKYRDDIAGAIVTGGTLNAYTVASYQGFDTLAHLDGAMIAFTPHITNGDTVTLNADGLGFKPLRASPGVELVAGTLVQGTPYTALYNNTDGVFYLRSYFSSPFNVPFLSGLDHWDTVTPNSVFIFPFGQAISRTVYARAFARWGVTHGPGDGSTTFNVPDKRGRTSAGLDNMGGSAIGRLTNGSMSAVRHTLGGAGGADTNQLGLTNLPTGITSANTGAISLSVTTNQKVVNGPNQGSAPGGGNQITAADAGSGGALSLLGSTGTIAISSAAVTSNNTGGAAHDNLQPTILCNYIIRII